jgi:hypothetical protein
MQPPKEWITFFFRVAFASVVMLVPAMLLLSAAEHGHVNAALVPWLNGLVRVLGPLGALALVGAAVAILVKRLGGH